LWAPWDLKSQFSIFHSFRDICLHTYDFWSLRAVKWAWKISFWVTLRVTGIQIVCCLFVIPVSRRVKGYTRFVGKYVTGKRKRFRPHKVYIFLIRITSRVDLAISVSLCERCVLGNYKISREWDFRYRFLSFACKIKLNAIQIWSFKHITCHQWAYTYEQEENSIRYTRG